MPGKLFGVGMGPGDPGLVTIKAKDVLEKADYIACPRSAAEKGSVAWNIASQVLEKKGELLELNFPMSRDEAVLKNGWDEAAARIEEKLAEGKTVAFVTLGDPTVFSTYMYVHKRVAAKGYETEIIPGITSFCAAAARAGISLAEERETVAIVPSAVDCADLEEIVERFDNIVLMKAGGKLARLGEQLKQFGVYDKAVLVSRLGMDGEIVGHDLNRITQEELSYFTTLIINKNDRNDF